MLDEDAEKEVGEYFDAVSEEPGEFGNARGVRNTFEKILTEQANRIAALPEITREELMRITLADVKTAVYGEEAADEADEADEAETDAAGSDETENPADNPTDSPADGPDDN